MEAKRRLLTDEERRSIFARLRTAPEFQSLDDFDITDSTERAQWEVVQFPEEPQNLVAAVFTRAKNRCRDRRRQRNREAQVMSLSREPVGSGKDLDLEDDALDPAAQILERERRDRQPVLLSDALRRCVRHWEQGELWTIKEAFERSLNNQSAETIKQEMGLSIRDDVFALTEAARRKLRESTLSVDTNRTVFTTLYRLHHWDVRPDEKDSSSNGSQPHPSSGTKHAQPIRHVSAPTLETWTEVLEWVLKNSPALCPSAARLIQYKATPTDKRLSDVAYHVDDVRCSFCRSDLSA